MSAEQPGTKNQDPDEDEPEPVPPVPDELPEWEHPLAIDEDGEPDGARGAVDGVDVPEELDVPEDPDEADGSDVPDEPEELVEDPEVDDPEVDDPEVVDESTAVDPDAGDLALVEAPAMDIPTPKLSPKAPRATPPASSGLLSFMI